MKAIPLSLVVALLMVGCGEEERGHSVVEDISLTRAKSVAKRIGLDDHSIILNAIDLNVIHDYDIPDDYTGWTKFNYGPGGGSKLSQWKDGKLDGLEIMWRWDGSKSKERKYKDSKVMSIEAWKPNGEKCPETNVKDGNGLVLMYNDDSTVRGRYYYKDGELVYD